MFCTHVLLSSLRIIRISSCPGIIVICCLEWLLRNMWFSEICSLYPLPCMAGLVPPVETSAGLKIFVGVG